MARDVYSSMAWVRTRLRVLERDGYICQVRLPGCRVKASAVDHIRELADGGDPYDMANLQAACVSCNSRKGHMARHARENRSKVRSW